MDLTDAGPIIGSGRKITGTNDYEAIKGSNIVVITAGFPRMPGMSREELLLKNTAIVKEAAKNIKRLCPESIIIVVTNPLDAMTFLAHKESGLPKARVMGMAGVLDTGRFIAILSEATGADYNEIETFVIGSHGDTMVPVLSQTKIKGKPLSDTLDKDKIAAIVSRTKNRGAEIVSMLKAGSAYYAPSASVFKMVRAILNDTKETLCVSCLLNGEYGLRDLFIGVPVKLGKAGILEIIELKLTDAEKRDFNLSAEAIKGTIEKA